MTGRQQGCLCGVVVTGAEWGDPSGAGIRSGRCHCWAGAGHPEETGVFDTGEEKETGVFDTHWQKGGPHWLTPTTVQ